MNRSRPGHNGQALPIESSLTKIWEEILDVLDKYLILEAAFGESKVFYHKVMGDYHRYLAESTQYKAMPDVAVTELPPAHPIRLRLRLALNSSVFYYEIFNTPDHAHLGLGRRLAPNSSVFYYEILNTPDRARHFSKEAFDDAITELDTLSKESYKDSMLIMQLLRDNLTLWTSDMQQSNKPTDKDDAADAPTEEGA